MAGLAIEGEPDGWLDAGYSVSMLAMRLEAELTDASTLGAQALARSWYGPAATAFSADWAARRTRYEDLIDLARRAAHAITAYGQALLDMQARARTVEYAWCSTGLHVLPGGEGFMLPPGAGALPQPARMSLEQTLVSATRDVMDLAGDVAAVAGDLIAALVPVIELLEEFGLAGFNSEYLREFSHEFMQVVDNPVFGIGLDTAVEVTKYAARNVANVADAARLAKLGEVGDRAATGIGLAVTGWDVLRDTRHEGDVASLEQNAGGIASNFYSLTVGSAVTVAIGGVLAETVGAAIVVAGAPEIVAGAVVVVGAVVIGGIVAAGVGSAVQTIVDHRNTIYHDAEDDLQDIESAF